jgi:uncharacterized repeat protein (TIGR01451 family)
LTAPAQASRGATITYSLVVTNNGPSTATNVALLLLAGPGLSFVSASPTPVVNVDGLWTWRLAKLDAGKSVTFTLRVKATRTATVLGAAVVGSDVPDAKLGNNAVVILNVATENAAIAEIIR